MPNEEQTLGHHAERLRRLLLSTVVVVVTGISQPLSLSPLIDTLNAQLLRSPEDAVLRQRVIDAYTMAFEPELALLEILGTPAGRADAAARGRVQFSLEQLGPATRSLRQAYLESPSDETLMFLAVLAYAGGNPRLGAFEVQRLKTRRPSLSVDLLNLYERFYLHNRTVIAAAAQRALQDADPVAFETYFPRPQISILSPGEGVATEADRISVIWEVRHSRPLRIVTIGGETVLEQAPHADVPSRETVQRSFSRLVPVREGKNPVVIAAEDMFGNRSSDTVTVHGLAFDLPPAWRSPSVDSLQVKLDLLRTAVADSVFRASPAPGRRALIVAGPAGAESDRFFHRALLWYELFSNEFIGAIPRAQTKLLAAARMTAENVRVLAENWLIKEATFQSMTTLVLSGEWRISQGRWDLVDSDGTPVNMRPWILQLRSLATSGMVLVIDGPIHGREMLEADLRDVAAGSTVPINAILLPPGESWEVALLALALRPDTAPSTPDMSVRDLSTSAPVLSNTESFLPILFNPAARIRQNHGVLYEDLRRNLATTRIDGRTRDRLLGFSSDWRRYNEITRYLRGSFTLEDFIIRVDEYLGRTGKPQ